MRRRQRRGAHGRRRRGAERTRRLHRSWDTKVIRPSVPPTPPRAGGTVASPQCPDDRTPVRARASGANRTSFFETARPPREGLPTDPTSPSRGDRRGPTTTSQGTARANAPPRSLRDPFPSPKREVEWRASPDLDVDLSLQRWCQAVTPHGSATGGSAVATFLSFHVEPCDVAVAWACSRASDRAPRIRRSRPAFAIRSWSTGNEQ